MRKLHRRRIKGLKAPLKDKMIKAPIKAKEINDGLESNIGNEKGGTTGQTD